MTHSPLAVSFVPCPIDESMFCRNLFIRSTKECLSEFDYYLFTSILKDWQSCSLLDSCFARWEKFVWIDTCESKDIQVLSFNVTGFDMTWHEVLLLVEKYEVDVAILFEAGDANLKLCRQLFSNFSLFF
jgi:hypothetical protein